MNQVGRVLKSLNQQPGFGDCLVDMLPEEHSGSSDAVASFLCFVLERQKIWSNKRKRREVLTTNHVLASKWFTNMYRYVNMITAKGPLVNYASIIIWVLSWSEKGNFCLFLVLKEGTYLVKNSQKGAYVIYEQPLI